MIFPNQLKQKQFPENSGAFFAYPYPSTIWWFLEVKSECHKINSTIVLDFFSCLKFSDKKTLVTKFFQFFSPFKPRKLII